jgi:intracellular septation protein A
MSKQQVQENPLLNILINVLIPVIALSAMSKEGEEIWRIGATKGMLVALIPPLIYGVWFFVKTRQTNFFSLLGLVSVALTGGLTIYLWNQDGTVKPNAALLFGIKEGSIPLMLGIAMLVSHRGPSPLLRAFLYNDGFFHIPLIEKTVEEKGAQQEYARLLWHSTLLFACSFLVSTVLNVVLALHFLGSLDYKAADAREVYNAKVAQITGWGLLVIGVPILIFMFFTLWHLFRGLRRVTGLAQEQLMLPR